MILLQIGSKNALNSVKGYLSKSTLFDKMKKPKKHIGDGAVQEKWRERQCVNY